MDRDVGGEASRGRCGGGIHPVAFERGGWGELFGQIEQPDPGGKRFLVVERWMGGEGAGYPFLVPISAIFKAVGSALSSVLGWMRKPSWFFQR